MSGSKKTFRSAHKGCTNSSYDSLFNPIQFESENSMGGVNWRMSKSGFKSYYIM